ncbi:DNA/RNA polymerases superfamily protein [Gossypium australe]|uniref:DNA/RNA polymerases superfamily protein n=1 Tax=Gossypium australe TaxID=47621 RepID=A0A5B6VP96_9ROSI|nr:DNA/RNA polymerases superfamily protein [Gossypium australe]
MNNSNKITKALPSTIIIFSTKTKRRREEEKKFLREEEKKRRSSLVSVLLHVFLSYLEFYKGLNYKEVKFEGKIANVIKEGKIWKQIGGKRNWTSSREACSVDHRIMDPDPEQALANDIESVAPAPAQGTASEESRPAASSPDERVKQTFHNMMSDWFSHYLRTIPAVQPPQNQNIPPVVPVIPPVANLERVARPPVDRIRKHGAQEFRAEDGDDAERAEFWLDSTVHIFDELSCTPDKCLKCAISLLQDSAYYWWNTLVAVVPKERITWDFFQAEFRKKYVSQRFIDSKHKEFLELK